MKDQSDTLNPQCPPVLHAHDHVERQAPAPPILPATLTRKDPSMAPLLDNDNDGYSEFQSSRSTVPKNTTPTPQHNRPTPTDGMTKKARLIRISIFLLFELSWLAFGIVCFLVVVEAPVLNVHLAGVRVEGDAFFRGLFTTGDIILDTFSSEWQWMFRRTGSMDNQTDRVSTLTSGLLDQVLHAWQRKASNVYYLMFGSILLLLVIQPVAPGAISIVPDTVERPTTLAVGSLPANSTGPTIPTVAVGSSGNTFPDPTTKRAEAVLIRATHFVYVAKVEHSALNYDTPAGLLLGLPSRADLSGHTRYTTDAVSFNFSCTLIPPNYINGSSMESSWWSFGDDMMAQLDYNAVPLNSDPRQWMAGFWPLMISSGSGASNGAMAWLAFGDRGGRSLLDLSALLDSQHTFNTSGWYDLVTHIQETNAGDADSYASYSTIATVLYCDPRMDIKTVEVQLQNRALTVLSEKQGRVGNIDQAEASRMLGRTLNGMVYDQVSAPSVQSNRLSRLAYEFLLSPPIDPSTSQLSYYPLQDLANITSSVNSYTLSAASNAYLDGYLGFSNTSAMAITNIERLMVSWPQWILTAVLVVLAAGMTVAALFTNDVERRPLTLATVANVLARSEDVTERKP